MNIGISGTNNNKNSQPRTEGVDSVVLTYSVLPDLKETLFTLNKHGASVHYIIEEDGNQIQFANDLTQETFCCGTDLEGSISHNQVSINVMLINDGESVFKENQIDKLIVFLQDIKGRYPHLDLRNRIRGLGEVAIKGGVFPHHIAPGKFFPWEQLAQSSLGLFLSTTPEQKHKVYISPESSKEEILNLQLRLKLYGQKFDYGYRYIEANGVYDDLMKAWVTRFNERYVPAPEGGRIIDVSLWSEASHLNLKYIYESDTP